MRPIITRTGEELSDEDIEALADEAERGYDLDKAKRVTIGRPSHGAKAVSPRIQVRVDPTLATASVLPWLEVDDESGPVSVSALGRLGLDYQPARELTAALVGFFAVAGVVFREPSLTAALLDQRDVAEAVDRLVGFATTEAPRQAALADIDVLIEMLQQGRAAPSTDPELLDHEEPPQPPPGAPELPDPKAGGGMAHLGDAAARVARLSGRRGRHRLAALRCPRVRAAVARGDQQ